MQVQRAVRLVTVQVNGHAGDRDMGEAQGDQQQLPPAQVPKAMGQPVHQGIQKGPIRQKHASNFLQAPGCGQSRDFKFFERKKTVFSLERP